MKKIILFISFFIICSQSIFAQSYELTCSVGLRTKNHRMEPCNNRTRFEVWLIYTDNTEQNIWNDHITSSHNNGKWVYFGPKSFSVNKRIKRVVIKGWHWDDPTWGRCKERGRSSSSVSISDYEYPCVFKTIHGGFMGGYDNGSYLTVDIKSKDLPLQYDIASEDKFVLPDKYNITIKPIGIYSSNSFKWEYSIVSSTSMWAPARYRDGFGCTNYSFIRNNCGMCSYDTIFDSCNLNGEGRWAYRVNTGVDWREIVSHRGRDILSIKGNDLPGIGDFVGDVVKNKKKIQIRINYGCGYSEVMTLDAMKSAPTIIASTVIPNKCKGGKEAQIKLKFSEPLLPGERINIGVPSFSPETSNITSFDATNSLIIPYSFTEGTYQINLIDKYTENLTAMYTGADAHQMSVTVTDPSPVDFNFISKNDVNCHQGADGKIVLGFTGGALSVYNAVYSKNGISDTLKNITSSTDTISGLSAGTYTLKVFDKNGCYALDAYRNHSVISVTINQPTAPVRFQAPDILDLSGFTTNNGHIKLNAEGGTAGYTYIWKKNNIPFTPQPANNTALGLEAATYFITVKDSKYTQTSGSNCNGCNDTMTIVLTQPDKLEVAINIKNQISCFGYNDGALAARIKGGKKPYVNSKWEKFNGSSWSIIKNNTDTVLYDLSNGKYRVTITDNARIPNTTTGEFELRNPPKLESLGFTHTTPSCYGYNNGTVKINVTGGRLPYSFNWNMSMTNTAQINNISAGQCAVQVTDSSGCSVNDAITVQQPALLNVTYTKETPSAHNASNGKITLNPTGGTTPYNYRWNYNNLTTNPLQNIPARDNPYTGITTDSRGCKDTVSVRMLYPLSVSIGQTATISCYGLTDGRLNATAVGGVGTNYSYKWYQVLNNIDVDINKSAPTIQVGAGTYKVRVTDIENNTVVSVNYVVSQPSKLQTTYTSVKPSAHNASDGRITLNLVGGTTPYSYQWNHNSATTNPLIGLPAKDTPYKAIITDSKGCKDSVSVNLIYPLQTTIQETQAVSCYGKTDGRLNVTAVGGVGTNYTYKWYQVLNGVDVDLNKSTQTIQGGTGTYKVKVTDTQNNSIFSSYTITQPTKLQTSYTTVTPSAHNASNGKITLNPTGGTTPYNYRWNYNNVTTNPLQNIPARDNPYSCITSDARGCKDTVSVRLLYPLSVSIGQTVTISCYGATDGRLKATAVGGVGTNYTYKWYQVVNNIDVNINKSTQTIQVGAGTYKVEVTDIEGNTAVSVNYIVSQPSKLQTTYTKTIPTTHNGTNGSITLTASGGTAPYNYQWDYNNATENPLQNIPARDNSYMGITTDARGCKDTTAVRIIYPLGVQLQIQAPVSCYRAGDAILYAYATGGVGTNYTYKWYKIVSGVEVHINQNTDTLRNVDKGVYLVKVIDVENNIFQSNTVTVVEPAALVLSFESQLSSAHNSTDGYIYLNTQGGTTPYSYQWNYNGVTTDSLKNIPPRDDAYKAVVTDVRGCTDSISKRLIYPLNVELQMLNPISCHQSANATLYAYVTGGVGTNYTYKWYEMVNGLHVEINHHTDTLHHVHKGIYSVKAIDEENNIFVSNSVSVIEPDPLLLNSESQLPTAYNTSDGYIYLNTQGGTMPYDYQWNYMGQTVDSLKNIPARDTDYKAIVTDARGCTDSISERLIYPLNVDLHMLNPISCNAASNAVLYASPTGGVGANYTYEWYKVENGTPININYYHDTLYNANAGVYRVETMDVENNTTTSNDVVIYEPGLLVLSLESQLPTAYNTSDGYIYLNTQGGTMPYRYQWNYMGQSVDSLKNIPARDTAYKAIVTDARGCIDSISERLIYPLNVEIQLIDSISCFGQANGKLYAGATGGVGVGYTYKWFKYEGAVKMNLLNFTDTLYNVATGMYMVEVKDIENNTVNSIDFIFDQPDTLVVTDSIILPSAYNSSDGSITLDIAGGTAPYTHKWLHNNSPNNPLLNIPAKDHPYISVTTDSRGCSDTVYSRIIYPLNSKIHIIDSISCFGRADGKLYVKTTGGVGVNYSYSWYKYENGIKTALQTYTDTLHNVTEGVYEVKATDIEGNTVEAQLEFSQPDVLEARYNAILPSTANGTDGSITLYPEGGTPPYAYLWNYNNKMTNPANNLPAIDSFYMVTISDTRGCIKEIKTRMVYPIEVSITLMDSVTCHESNTGRLAANAAGGVGKNYRYTWYKLQNTQYVDLDTNDSILANISGGIYRVRATDLENNYVYSSDFNLYQPNLLVVKDSIVLPSNYNTPDGSITLSTTGGNVPYVYKWLHNGSTNPYLVNISANDHPYVSVTTDRKGCADTVYSRVIYPLQVKIQLIDSVSCYAYKDGKLQAKATGGVGTNYKYKWYRYEKGIKTDIFVNTAILNNAVAGTYVVDITDIENNSISSTDFVLNQPFALTLTSVKHDLKCKFDKNGQIEVFALGGNSEYKYLWNTGNLTNSIKNIIEGVYSVKVTDRKGCIATKTDTISAPNELLLSISNTPPSGFNYSDAQVKVLATGGVKSYTYQWAGHSEISNTLASIPHGAYTVKVTDANGCPKTISDTVINPPLLEISILQTKEISCNGRNDGELTANSIGGVGTHYYQWYQVESNNLKLLSNRVKLQNLPSGIYRLKVTDDNGVSSVTTDFVLTQPNLLKATIEAGNIYCMGSGNGWLEALPTGGTAPFKYEWTGGESTGRINNLKQGKQLVFVSDARGCVTKAIGEIVLSNNPLIINEKVTQPQCYNSQGTVDVEVKGGLQPYAYNWSDGSSAKGGVRNIPAGSYTITVSDSMGCAQQAKVEIHNPEPIIVNIEGNKTLCRGQSLLFDATHTEGVSYSWSKGNKAIKNTPDLLIDQEGLYTVTVTTAKGCKGQANVNINLNNKLINANFAVASKVEIGQILRLVNTNPTEEEIITWVFDKHDPVYVVDSSKNSLRILFDKAGTYSLGMKAKLGDCEQTVYKSIEVVDKFSIGEETKTDNDPYLKKFVVYPNPSTGLFTVEVELKESDDIELNLFTLSGVLVSKKTEKGSNKYVIPYDISSSPGGIYIIKLVTSKIHTSVKIIKD